MTTATEVLAEIEKIESNLRLILSNTRKRVGLMAETNVILSRLEDLDFFTRDQDEEMDDDEAALIDRFSKIREECAFIDETLDKLCR